MSNLSAHKRSRVDTVPFDRFKVPPKQNLFAMPFIWLFCYAVTRKGRLRINKVRMDGLKPPFLVLGTHHAFSDFYVTPLALFPYRANYISELEGFEAFGEWPYRQAGCLGTRKFVNDIALVRNIRRVIERKGILCLYPEARYANVGTNSELPESVGKLAKLLDVPVVVINMHGNYLQSPIWNLTIRKEVAQEAVLTQVLTKDELRNSSVDEINARLSEYLSYDEYRDQFTYKHAVTYEKRAEGLHLALYRCPHCQSDFTVKSSNADLFCESCGSRWRMTEYGRMVPYDGENPPAPYTVDDNGFDLAHIPDWYEWQRRCVNEEIDRGEYSLDVKVHIESLPNAVNFIDLGEGMLHHDADGFTLTFKDYGDSDERTMTFPASSMLSIHTEYDYRGMGQCVTLSTLDNTYFLFPRGDGFNATRIQFATEYFYKLSHKKKRLLTKI